MGSFLDGALSNVNKKAVQVDDNDKIIKDAEAERVENNTEEAKLQAQVDNAAAAQEEAKEEAEEKKKQEQQRKKKENDMKAAEGEAKGDKDGDGKLDKDEDKDSDGVRDKDQEEGKDSGKSKSKKDNTDKDHVFSSGQSVKDTVIKNEQLMRNVDHWDALLKAGKVTQEQYAAGIAMNTLMSLIDSENPLMKNVFSADSYMRPSALDTFNGRRLQKRLDKLQNERIKIIEDLSKSENKLLKVAKKQSAKFSINTGKQEKDADSEHVDLSHKDDDNGNNSGNDNKSKDSNTPENNESKAGKHITKAVFVAAIAGLAHKATNIREALENKYHEFKNRDKENGEKTEADKIVDGVEASVKAAETVNTEQFTPTGESEKPLEAISDKVKEAVEEAKENQKTEEQQSAESTMYFDDDFHEEDGLEEYPADDYEAYMQPDPMIEEVVNAVNAKDAEKEPEDTHITGEVYSDVEDAMDQNNKESEKESESEKETDGAETLDMMSQAQTEAAESESKAETKQPEEASQSETKPEPESEPEAEKPSEPESETKPVEEKPETTVRENIVQSERSIPQSKDIKEVNDQMFEGVEYSTNRHKEQEVIDKANEKISSEVTDDEDPNKSSFYERIKSMAKDDQRDDEEKEDEEESQYEG